MRASLILLVVITGCASVQVTPLNPPPQGMAEREPAEVRIYLTKQPEHPYEEIYMIRADADNSEKAVQAMRKKAGELGCDALVITGNADRVVSAPDATGNATISMREGFLGSCIVFQ